VIELSETISERGFLGLQENSPLETWVVEAAGEVGKGNDVYLGLEEAEEFLTWAAADMAQGYGADLQLDLKPQKGANIWKVNCPVSHRFLDFKLSYFLSNGDNGKLVASGFKAKELSLTGRFFKKQVESEAARVMANPNQLLETKIKRLCKKQGLNEPFPEGSLRVEIIDEGQRVKLSPAALE
jgi:hypothetical protein